jgi:circadian clock protein KaiB
MVMLLKLFVAGNTLNSERAIQNLKIILKNPELKGKYKLEVIDVIAHPQLAEDEKIIATPVLERRLPPPVRRILGDLSDKERVLIGLDLIRETEKNEEVVALRKAKAKAKANAKANAKKSAKKSAKVKRGRK